MCTKSMRMGAVSEHAGNSKSVREGVKSMRKIVHTAQKACVRAQNECMLVQKAYVPVQKDYVRVQNPFRLAQIVCWPEEKACVQSKRAWGKCK